MAKIWYKDASAASHSAATLGWVAFLKTNGILTHVQSGDGASTLSSGADVFAPGVQRSWARYALAGGTRELLIQIINDGTSQPGRSFRVKYSRASGFVNAPTGGGVTSATLPPSATDETFIAGWGTDNANAGMGFYPGTGTYKLIAMCDTTAPYGFWVAIYSNATGVPAGMFFMDPLKSATFDATDGDPYVFYMAGNLATDVVRAAIGNAGLLNASSLVGTSGTTTNDVGSVRSWWKYNLAGATWANCPMVAFATRNSSGSLVIAIGLFTDNVTGKQLPLPCVYLKDVTFASPNGWRGVSSFFRWRSGGTAAINTLSISSPTSKEYIIHGDLVMDWDGTDPNV